jgi:hypothetical protein
LDRTIWNYRIVITGKGQSWRSPLRPQKLPSILIPCKSAAINLFSDSTSQLLDPTDWIWSLSLAKIPFVALTRGGLSGHNILWLNESFSDRLKEPTCDQQPSLPEPEEELGGSFGCSSNVVFDLLLPIID